MKRRYAIIALLLVLCLAVWLCLSPTDAADALDPMPSPELATTVASSSAVPLHPTYNGEVAAIVDQNCVACHRRGGTAPFPLIDYASVRRHAKDIVRVTEKHTMPPWKPAAGWGSFVSERRLEPVAIATLQRWVQDGRPQGTEPRPTPPHFSDSWSLGSPDLVLGLKRPFEVPADGPDIYHCFVLPIPLEQDTAIAAVDLQPDNPAVVHHALLFLDTSGRARARCKGPLEDGYPAFGGIGFVPSGAMGGWAPGASAVRLPDGVVRMVKRGSDLVVQVHFHPSGKVEHAQPRIALYFADQQQGNAVLDNMGIATLPLRLPAGDACHVLRDHFILPVGVKVYLVGPHAHLLCKDIQAVATLPDGHVVPLIWIPDWDFAWQGQYQYRQPLHLPAGSRIDVRYVYDNSAANPRNPNRPPEEVHFGEQTTDEMALMFFGVVPDHPDDMARLRLAMRQHAVNGLLSRDGLETLVRLWKRRRNQE